jgi:hypothetical protein
MQAAEILISIGYSDRVDAGYGHINYVFVSISSCEPSIIWHPHEDLVMALAREPRWKAVLYRRVAGTPTQGGKSADPAPIALAERPERETQTVEQGGEGQRR